MFWIDFRNHTDNNSALGEVDKKRERQRNFVSAKTGFYGVILLVIGYGMWLTVYASELDDGTKAYILSLYYDVVNCIINPFAVLFSSPVVARKLKKKF